MNCIKCGNNLSPQDTTCPKCNTPVGQSTQPVNSPVTENTDIPVLLPDAVNTPQEEPKVATPIVQPAPPEVPKEEAPVEELASPQETSRSKVEIKPMERFNKQFNIYKAAFLVLLVVVSIGGGVTFGLHSKSNSAASQELAIKNSYNIRIGDITYKIPGNFVYTQITDGIEVSDVDETWTSDIGPLAVAYADIRTYAKSIQTSYKNYQYKVSEIQTKTLNDREYMTMEVTKDNQSILIAFANATSNMTHLITVKNKDNTIDYKALEDIATILNNSKVNDNGVGIKTPKANLDFNTIKNSIVNTTVTQKRIEMLQKAQKAKKK